MAILLSLYVTGLRIFRGPEPFANLGVSYRGILAVYLLGGAIAGGIVGVLWPLTRRRFGAALVAAVGGFIVYSAAGVLLDGNPLQWTTAHWAGPIGLGLFWGLLGATILFRKPRPITPAPLPSRLRTVKPDGHRDPEA